MASSKGVDYLRERGGGCAVCEGCPCLEREEIECVYCK